MVTWYKFVIYLDKVKGYDHSLVIASFCGTNEVTFFSIFLINGDNCTAFRSSDDIFFRYLNLNSFERKMKGQLMKERNIKFEVSIFRILLDLSFSLINGEKRTNHIDQVTLGPSEILWMAM